MKPYESGTAREPDFDSSCFPAQNTLASPDAATNSLRPDTGELADNYNRALEVARAVVRAQSKLARDMKVQIVRVIVINDRGITDRIEEFKKGF